MSSIFEDTFGKAQELAREMSNVVSSIVQLVDERERNIGLSQVLRQASRIRTVLSDRSQFLRNWDVAPALPAARALVLLLARLQSVRPGLTHESPYNSKTIEEELAIAIRLVARLEMNAGPAGEVSEVMES